MRIEKLFDEAERQHVAPREYHAFLREQLPSPRAARMAEAAGMLETEESAASGKAVVRLHEKGSVSDRTDGKHGGSMQKIFAKAFVDGLKQLKETGSAAGHARSGGGAAPIKKVRRYKLHAEIFDALQPNRHQQLDISQAAIRLVDAAAPGAAAAGGGSVRGGRRIIALGWGWQHEGWPRRPVERGLGPLCLSVSLLSLFAPLPLLPGPATPPTHVPPPLVSPPQLEQDSWARSNSHLELDAQQPEEPMHRAEVSDAAQNDGDFLDHHRKELLPEVNRRALSRSRTRMRDELELQTNLGVESHLEQLAVLQKPTWMSAEQAKHGST